MIRRKSILLVGALALAGLAAPTAGQAALSDCNNNYMCVWGNNDYVWKLAEQAHGQDSWLDPFNAEENDENDSWANRSATYTGCMAEHTNGGGDRLTMAKLSNDNDMAWFNSNETSSMKTKNGC